MKVWLGSKTLRAFFLKSLYSKSGLFDAEWYRSYYHDVARAGVDPLSHFCTHGDFEGRHPGPDFDSVAYRELWPDVALSGMGNLEYFLRVGRKLGHDAPSWAANHRREHEFRGNLRASGIFDERWYLARYPDVAKFPLGPFAHFVIHGAKEWRDPGPSFDSWSYAARYAQLLKSNEAPVEHFLSSNTRPESSSSKESNLEFWRSQALPAWAEDTHELRRSLTHAAGRGLLVLHVFDQAACANARSLTEAALQLVSVGAKVLIAFGGDVTEPDRSCLRRYIPAEHLDIVLDEHDAAAIADLFGCEWVLFAHGNVEIARYAPSALLEFAAVRRDVRFVYCDHVQRDDVGGGETPAFKPVFSPEYLRNEFYIGPCLLARADRECRGQLLAIFSDLRAGRNDEVTAALLSGPPGSILHVPHLLYQTSSQSSQLARARSFLRQGFTDDDQRPTVSIIVATRDCIDLLRSCIESIETETIYPRTKIEILIVDNGSTSHEAEEFFAERSSRQGYKVLRDQLPFNFSRLNNRAAEIASGEVLILLNNDTVVIDPYWIEKFATHCRDEDVGVVGCKLLYPDGTIQHGGCVVGFHGLAAHRLVGRGAHEVANRDFTRELSAVTGACIAIRRATFRQIGGMDEALAVAFGDTLLCLSCLEAGYRNIYIADPLLVHHESKTRGLDDTRAKARLMQREALYCREQLPNYFRNDPYYSPNLSLETMDSLAYPPRRPKLRLGRVTKGPSVILILSSTHEVGHGVATVVKAQAEFLAKVGYNVLVGGPGSDFDLEYEGCRRLYTPSAMHAAWLAYTEDVDCVIAHTPPFFSITRFLGDRPFVYFYDHGEPDPGLFPDREAREDVDMEKRLCAALAARIFAISQSVKNQTLFKNTRVLRNGNSHLAAWSREREATRIASRAKLGWDNKFVILNVCRFQSDARLYKGVDRYAEVANEFRFLHPDLYARSVFVLAGKAEPRDVEEMRDLGIEVCANVTDARMTELYESSDLYMNFSKWEGYNLGVGQALAMGLPVIASDIEAHREFPIFTSNNIRCIIERLAAIMSGDFRQEARTAVISSWDVPFTALLEDLHSDGVRPGVADG